MKPTIEKEIPVISRLSLHSMGYNKAAGLTEVKQPASVGVGFC